MSDEILWQIFADTGDPMSWLVYRASKKKKNNEAAKEYPLPQN